MIKFIKSYSSLLDGPIVSHSYDPSPSAVTAVLFGDGLCSKHILSAEFQDLHKTRDFNENWK